MFKENRPSPTQEQSNTPEGWDRRLRRVPALTSWKSWQLGRSPEFRWIRQYLHSPILDAACGAGRWTAFIAARGFSVKGLDYAPGQVAANRLRYPGLEWLVGDVRATGLPSSGYGGITCFGGIEHDPAGPGAALREFHRLLRPGACCIVTAPADHARRRAVSLMDNPRNEGAFYEYFLTAEEFADETRKAGFEVVHSGLVPRVSIALASPHLYRKTVGTRWFFLARLAALFAPLDSCAARVICIARKPA